MRRSALSVWFAALALAQPGLAQLPVFDPPPENPTTPAKVVLGKILFWDEQLSSDDSTACGTCHQPAFGGSDPRSAAALHPGPDGLFGTADDSRGSFGLSHQNATGTFTPAGSFGHGRQVTRRVANPHIGASFHQQLFWDMRGSTTFVDPETGAVLIPLGGGIESQAAAPIVSSVEMATEGRTWQDVREKLQDATPLALATSLTSDVQAALQQNPTYPLLFQAAFGDPVISASRIAYAIAAYERTLVPDDTPWDRFMAGQTAAMTTIEQQGWLLFQSFGGCVACHWAPTFTDDLGHVLGLRPAVEDLGISLDIGVVGDVGSFKTPSLRNAGLRPRLFHNGQSPALGDPAQLTDPASTLNVYLQGGGVDMSNIDPFLQPLGSIGITTADMQAMQEFVRTGLTDARTAFRLPPFDHPDLRSTVVPPPRVFGQGRAGTIEPFLIDTVPSYPGNEDWKLGLVGGAGTTLGFLGIGLSSFEPNHSVFGIPIHVDVTLGLPVLLQGQGNGTGAATLRIPIPDAPWLTQVPFYFQMVAFDPQAPWGVAASKGTEIRIR